MTTVQCMCVSSVQICQIWPSSCHFVVITKTSSAKASPLLLIPKIWEEQEIWEVQVLNVSLNLHHIFKTAFRSIVHKKNKISSCANLAPFPHDHFELLSARSTSLGRPGKLRSTTRSACFRSTSSTRKSTSSFGFGKSWSWTFSIPNPEADSWNLS